MKFITTFFVITLIATNLLISQNISPRTLLRYGDNYKSSIETYGEVDEYYFEGKSGDVIMIRMRDETAVDSYIKLYDPDGSFIAYNWSDGGLAKIKDLHLSKSGEYKILAFDRNHNDTGNYGISLHQLNGHSYSTGLPEIISFTDSITSITGVNTYHFQVKKDDILFAQMRALTVHFECEFFIYNSLGEEIYKSENIGRLATVGPVRITQEDTLKIIVTDRGGNDVDIYGLTKMLLNQHESVQNLTCGNNVLDELTQLCERKVYRLVTSPGQIPLIEVRSNNAKIETTIEIFDENGEFVASTTATNKLISQFIEVSEEEKSYLLVVCDRNGNDFGDFGLQVQFLDATYCPEVLDCSNQEEMVLISGLGQNKLFSIEGFAGDSIKVKLHELESHLEPHLRIYNLKGEMIAEVMDPILADLSSFTFPEDGTYLILASDQSGNDVGMFELLAPFTDFEILLSECHTVYLGFGPFESVILSAPVADESASYVWSNGATTSEIEVSPTENTSYFVTITNSNGCFSVAQTFVEVVDVACEPKKVQICHDALNSKEKSEKCISENGVWGHLENGIGHENCYIGPCNYISICDSGEENLAIDREVTQRTNGAQSVANILYPNPTSNSFSIELNLIPGEKVNIGIYNIIGEKIGVKQFENKGQQVQLSMDDYNVPAGLYLVLIKSDLFSETKQVIYLK